MKIVKFAPGLFFSAVVALSFSFAADLHAQCATCGDVNVTERITDKEVIFRTRKIEDPDTSRGRSGMSGPIFGTNDCTRRKCGGAIFGPQTCKKIVLPCEDCKPEKKQPNIKNYTTVSEDIYEAIHSCGEFAPLQLEWVDFRIKKGRGQAYSRKLGNYRFRLFGCRRDSKTAMLNEGRIMQRDMHFIRIFDDMVGSCYPIVKIPNDVCLDSNKDPVPEYILTAEITDYFMNVCDAYDWDEAKKENLRTGSAEMTITWRLMDLTKTNVLWKGESTGYAEVEDGEYNAEMILIERSFADAVSNLRTLPGFEDQLAVRVSPDVLAQQRRELAQMERLNDPVKCQYQEEIKQAVVQCPVIPQKQPDSELIPLEASTLPICEPQQQQPELLAICPEGDESCTGSLEELRVADNPLAEAEQLQEIQLSDNRPTDFQPVAPEQETYVYDDEESDAPIENGGFLADGNQITEASGVTETAQVIGYDDDGNPIYEAEEAVVETGGAMCSGSSFEEMGEVEQALCTVDENGNSDCDSSLYTAMLDDGICEVLPLEPEFDNQPFCEPSIFGFLHKEDRSCEPSPFQFLHEENHDCEPSIFDRLFNTRPSCQAGLAEEDSGFIESGFDDSTVGAVTEAGGVIDKTNEWVEVPFAPEEAQDAVDRNSLCVINRGPYDKLTPENLYKVRASIVSVVNAKGEKGAGLLISNQFVLTSADLIVKDLNRYQLRTINGVDLGARAVRVNVKKNTALLLLDEKTLYMPLSLNLNLPEVGQGGFMALGLLEEDSGEGYLDNDGKVSGYRYSDDRGAEIMVDTFVQAVSVGGALIDAHGTINGLAASGKKSDDTPDLFVPIVTAINSIGLEICGQQDKAPQVPMAVIKPVSTAIDSFTGSKEPKAMSVKSRK